MVAFLQNELTGLDLKTGRILWRQPYSVGYDEHAAFPLYKEPYLRTMQPFRAGSDLYVLDVADPTGCQLKLVRHDPQMSNDTASSVLVGDCVYGFDLHGAQASPNRPSHGLFRCMDFKTGETLWSSDRPGHATIAVADKKLLLFNDRGEVVLVRANPQFYEELARTEVFRGEICWTAPSLHRGRLYLRSPSRVACLYVGTPGGLDRRQQESAVPASSIPKARRVELGWLLGAERDYPFELPRAAELTRWYLFSLGAVAVAGALATGAYGVSRLRRRQSACLVARTAFWLGMLVGGVAATPLGNRFSSHFVFTWPVSLLVMHQFALASVFKAKQPDRGQAAAWGGALGTGLLVLACLVYYDLTRRLSLPPAWYFLPTFLVAWPLAVPAARRLVRPGTVLGDLLWMVLVFFGILLGIRRRDVVAWRGRSVAAEVAERRARCRRSRSIRTCPLLFQPPRKHSKHVGNSVDVHGYGPPAGTDNDIGPVLVELGLGDADGSIEIVVGQGRVQDFVAVVLEIGRFHAAWCRLPAVEEEDGHGAL